MVNNINNNLNLNLKEIGARIAYYRKENNISQEKLASMLGVSVPQMSRLEGGKALLNIFEIMKICEIFDISANDLIMYNLNYTKDDCNNMNNIMCFVIKSLNILSEKDKGLVRNVLEYVNNRKDTEELENI